VKTGQSNIYEKVFAFLFLILAGILVFGMIKNKQEQDRLEYFEGEGDSMLPTISPGTELTVDPEKDPKEEDIIVFTCPKCKVKENDIDILTKRLIAKNEKGCFWVEGDNKEKSYDSRDFGWLCPEDIELHGTVVEMSEGRN
jgi:signal peptidase I